MADKLALLTLYDAVVAQFAADDMTGVAQPFGWRFVAQHFVGNRIVWVPGNPIGMVGNMLPPRNPGGDPRSLGTLDEQFYVVICGQDPSDPENERAQYDVTRRLRDFWFRAVYHAAHGTFRIVAEEWITSKLERRHGTAIRLVGAIQSKVPDIGPDGPEYALAPDDTGAEVEVSELDNTETLTVEAP